MARPHCLLALAGLALGCSTSARPGHAPVRRLTPTEYNQTVRDLYGFATADDWPEIDEEDEAGIAIWPQTLPPDIAIHGFEGMVDGQVASPYHAERVQAVALHFARFAPDADHFWDCADHDSAACITKSIHKLAARAWRRPLSDDERDRLQARVDELLADNEPRAAIQLTVAGILSAPQFVYHIERAVPSTPALDDRGREQLADWTMASRLSYFLWDSMPDPALYTAAAEGRLSSREEINAEARRMLKSWRAREAVVHFHRQWLDLESVHQSRIDLDTYAPRYAEEIAEIAEDEGLQEREEAWSGALVGLRAGMIREAELFVERTIFDGEGTLAALLTDHHGYVTSTEGYLGTQTTADIYGVDSGDIHNSHSYSDSFDDGNLGFELTIRPATYPKSQRAGILTQAAVLTSTSHPVHPAPVLRGTLVLEQLTCRHMGQPPEGAEGAAPPDTIDAEATNRVRLEAVTSNTPCNSCHDQINPVGFAFEHYDSMGGWRDQDNGQPVDSSGTLQLPGEPLIRFDDAVGLAHGLAKSRTVHDCYALHWTRYALGRDLAAEETPALTQIQDSFWNSGGRIDALLVAIVGSDLFRTRSATEGEPAPDAYSGATPTEEN